MISLAVSLTSVRPVLKICYLFLVCLLCDATFLHHRYHGLSSGGVAIQNPSDDEIFPELVVVALPLDPVLLPV